MYITVVRSHSHLPEPTALRLLELIKVLLRERAHGRNTGGSRRRRDEDYILLGHGAKLTEEGPHALCITLRLFVDKRKLLNVRQRLDIRGLHSRFIKRSLVIRGIVVGKLYDLLQICQLSLFQFLPGKCLQFLVPVLVINISAHFSILRFYYSLKFLSINSHFASRDCSMK